MRVHAAGTCELRKSRDWLAFSPGCMHEPCLMWMTAGVLSVAINSHALKGLFIRNRGLVTDGQISSEKERYKQKLESVG